MTIDDLATPGPTGAEVLGAKAGGNELFATTHWSVVLSASQGGSAQAEAALASLCQGYWYPLYAFARRQGQSPQDAQDLVQGFFAKALEKNYFGDADPHKGRFRSFLLLAFKRFMANERDRLTCKKRGGDREFVSLSAEEPEARYLNEPRDEMSPEKLFDRHWATVLLEQVLLQLEREYTSSGNARVFQELKVFLTGEKSERPYAEIAQVLGIAEGTLRGTVFRLRQRFRDTLKQRIAQTVNSPEEVDEELRHLFSALS